MSSFSNKIQMCKQSALYVTLTTPSTAAPAAAAAAAAASVALDKQMQQEKCFRGGDIFDKFSIHFSSELFSFKTLRT